MALITSFVSRIDNNLHGVPLCVFHREGLCTMALFNHVMAPLVTFQARFSKIGFRYTCDRSFLLLIVIKVLLLHLLLSHLPP